MTPDEKYNLAQRAYKARWWPDFHSHHAPMTEAQYIRVLAEKVEAGYEGYIDQVISLDQDNCLGLARKLWLAGKPDATPCPLAWLVYKTTHKGHTREDYQDYIEAVIEGFIKQREEAKQWAYYTH